MTGTDVVDIKQNEREKKEIKDLDVEVRITVLAMEMTHSEYANQLEKEAIGVKNSSIEQLLRQLAKIIRKQRY